MCSTVSFSTINSKKIFIGNYQKLKEQIERDPCRRLLLIYYPRIGQHQIALANINPTDQLRIIPIFVLELSDSPFANINRCSLSLMQFYDAQEDEPIFYDISDSIDIIIRI